MPAKYEHELSKISLTLSSSNLKLIAKKRGKLSRSKFIDDILTLALTNNKRKGVNGATRL